MELEKNEKHRSHYATDYKDEIIRMLNSGKNVSEISRTFGIGKNVLYTWNRTAEADESKNKS